MSTTTTTTTARKRKRLDASVASATTEPTEVVDAESILASLAKGADVKSLIASAITLESDADRLSVVATPNAWRATGAILAAALKSDDANVKLHEVSQAKCHEVLTALCKSAGVAWKSDTGEAKRRLRAHLYVTPDLLVDALATMGRANGPKSRRVTDIISWCQMHDTAGKSIQRKRKGTPVVTKSQADKVRKTREADAIAARDKVFAQVKRASADTVFGIVSAGAVKSATDAQIQETIDALTKYLAAKQAK